MSIYGPIISASDLEDAVLSTLEKWFPTYLTEYELAKGIINFNNEPSRHPLPLSWIRSDQLDRSAGDQLPCIVVVSPGLSRNKPAQEGDGSFRAFFNIGVAVFASATTERFTLDLVRVYTAIIRTIMLQKQDLDGVADGCTWLDESYDDNFPLTDDQTLSAGQVVFEIEVAGLVNRFSGPATTDPLPDQPGSEWPLANLVIAEVNGVTASVPDVPPTPPEEDELQATVSVTPAQMATINTAPVELVPGVPGKIIWPTALLVGRVGGVVDYDQNVVVVGASSIVGQGSDWFGLVIPNGIPDSVQNVRAGTPNIPSSVAGDSLVVGSQTALNDGDWNLEITVTYTLV